LSRPGSTTRPPPRPSPRLAGGGRTSSANGAPPLALSPSTPVSPQASPTLRAGCAKRSRRAAAPCLLALALVACNNPVRRLDDANEARHAGRPREALAGYQEVLAELGEGRLPAALAEVRLRAVRYAADVAYLELGEFTQAISFYRRVVALYPGTPDAWKARAAIGDIYRERLGDRMAAIAQWAELAASDAPDAAGHQLKVAREYLDLRNFEQARTEARAVRERWPRSDLADEAQLLTAQAWALEARNDEAQRAFQALLDRAPRPDVAARALEGQAHLAAQDGRLDRAIELYARALPAHPNPEAIRLAIGKVRQRRDSARTVKPGDRAAALDQHLVAHRREIR
jgi:tetratricopeptide (TPR) repeat protein